jgi:branched-chain amino acid transport system substrate-binding protein
MHMSTRITYALGAAAFALAWAIVPGHAQKTYDEGASDTEIKIGNTNPYSGNFSSYGQIGKTIEAKFKEVNDKGGINGRKINFITYDDGFTPPKSLEMSRKLIEEDKVLLLFNTLGTAPNSAIQKYANTKKVPHLFVATGASKWGKPAEFPWTMGWQPDYVTEFAIYAKHILANVKDPKIAVLYLNDDAGKDFLEGFKSGLGKENEKLIVQASSHEGTDPTVDSQMIQLKNSGANVFVIGTGPKHAAQAIKKSGELAWKRDATYVGNVSASVGSVLKPAGLDNAQGLITAQYLKEVSDKQWEDSADIKAFKAFMGKYMPNADLSDANHAYGYSVTHLIVHVLKAAGDNLTRENVMKVAASLKGVDLPLLLPGIKVNTSPTDFYPIQAVQMSRFKGEKWELFGEILASESK